MESKLFKQTLDTEEGRKESKRKEGRNEEMKEQKWKKKGEREGGREGWNEGGREWLLNDKINNEREKKHNSKETVTRVYIFQQEQLFSAF